MSSCPADPVSSAQRARYPAGREPITERTLRRLLESLVWEDQRALWAEMRAVAG